MGEEDFLWDAEMETIADGYKNGLKRFLYRTLSTVSYTHLERKACPPQGKISESVDETSYGKSSSNCTELAPYYPANNGAESGSNTKTLFRGDRRCV